MPRQLDWWEQKLKADRQARKTNRVRSRPRTTSKRRPSARPRDRPFSVLEAIKKKARHSDSPCGIELRPVQLRPNSQVLRHLAYYCGNRSSLLDDFEASRYADALLALSAHWRDWLRPIEDWQPPADGTAAQFSSLVRHLLARYEVPSFLDDAWKDGPTADGFTHQNWFKLIGGGRNIRTADDLPIPLTKRMAHHFFHAPSGLGIRATLRYAQVLGLGGDERLARSLLTTRIGTCFYANDFWETVIRWLIDHPEIDSVHHGPIIAYLHDQKFGPSLPAGLVRGQRRLIPARPNLCMTGRSAGSMLRAVERWHGQLSLRRGDYVYWKPSGLPPLTVAEVEDGRRKVFAITELISSAELEEEGAALGHCVAGYRALCQAGQFSIWSLTVEDSSGRIERLLTLQVQNSTGEIVQARGNLNRMPREDEIRILGLWAGARGPSAPPSVLGSMIA